MNRKKYLVKNTAIFALNSIGTRLITFFLVPLYTYAFSTAEYGSIDLVTTIATIFVPIITLNIGEAVMRFSLDKDANYNSIMSIGLVFMMLSFALGSTIVLVLRFFPAVVVESFVVYLFCVSQGLFMTLSCYLRGQEKLFQYAVANILSTFCVAILNIVFLLFFHLGINGYFYAYIISYFIVTLYSFYESKAYRLIISFKLDFSQMKDMVKYSIVLVPNSFMWWIMNSSDHIMVTSMISIAANGIYAISYKIPSILSTMSTVFNQAWSYSAIHENESEDREAFNNNMFDKLVRFQLVITVFLMLAMKPFMKIYVQPEYYEAWKYTPYLLVGYFFLTMGTFLSTSYTVNKDSKGFLYSGTFGAVLNVSLNWILIPRFGIHGAAFATCISYIAVFIYRYFDTKKYLIIRAFKSEYVLGYFLLLMSAISMIIPSNTGLLILLAETVLMVIINRSIFKEMTTLVKNTTKRKRT